ncbi:hypothetical protein HYW20_01815 [Candidatus Woesearchaeota archaeon]|nr:hypothetical protein [Candidatus Woesearchaeota archaeon]
MKHPHLGEADYFKIPPRVTRKELEVKLDSLGLLSYESVNRALDSLEEQDATDNIPLRNSGASTLDEHIRPVTALVLEYLVFEQRKESPDFRPIPPEGAVVPLLHETFDSPLIDRTQFEKLHGQAITDMLWMLGDTAYINRMDSHLYLTMTSQARYREKTKMKFEALEGAPPIVQATCLADKLNNTLCFYGKDYIGKNGTPTQRMRRAIDMAITIALPVADVLSPDFFAPMLREELAYYKNKYTATFGNLKF